MSKSQVSSLIFLVFAFLLGSVLSAAVLPADEVSKKEVIDEDQEVSAVSSTVNKVGQKEEIVVTNKPAARPAPQTGEKQAAFKGDRSRSSGRASARQVQGKSGRVKSRAKSGKKAARQAAASTASYGDYNYGDYGAVTVKSVNRRRKNKKGKRRQHGPNETSEEVNSNRRDYGNYNYGG